MKLTDLHAQQIEGVGHVGCLHACEQSHALIVRPVVYIFNKTDAQLSTTEKVAGCK